MFVDNVVRIAIQVAKDRNNDYELRQAALKNLGRLYEGSRFRANFKTALYAAAENIADSMPVDELGDTAQDVMTRINLRSEKPARPRPNLH